MVFSEFDKMKTNHLIIVISINTVSKSHSVVSNPLQPHGLQPTRLLRPWNSPGKSTGSHPPVQGILSTPGWNWSPALQADSLPSEPAGEAQSTQSICIVDPVHDANCLTVHTVHWTQGRQGAKAKRLEEDTRSAGTAAAAAESPQSVWLCATP